MITRTQSDPGTQTIRWEADYAAAVRRAKAENKPLFVDFFLPT